MRSVIVYKYQRNAATKTHDKVEDGTASFHQWGLECDVGSYSVAIVEREDGTIEMIAPDMIKFIE